MDPTADPFTLHPDAYHGPLGGVVKAVSPHTEADDPAVLACLLAAFGNAVGFGPHWHHGKPHGANLFVGLVGPTASRKGTATGIAKAVITQADPEWEARVQHEGFGSGEGLIWAVRDAVGEDDPGVEDKRLLVVEEEWAKMFTLGAADKSILTPIIRQAFDRIGIGKPNKGANAYKCRHPHISIIGNITPDDLRQSLTGKNAVTVANGFMNRFLLVGTRRTKYLPRGGRWREHADLFVPVIREALEKAKTRTLMSLDAEAEPVWDDLYPSLEDRPDGVPGAVTGRASDMVTKLAMVYALADGDDTIRLVHLRAGLAMWRYCESTAYALFGGPSHDTEPEPLWLRLANAIAQRPGISRSELTVAHRRFGNANAIGEALGKVKANGLAHCRLTQNPNGGPKRECWYPGPEDGSGDGSEPNNVPPPLPAVVPGSSGPVNPFAGCVVEGDGSPTSGKQTTNSPTGVDPQGGIVVCLPAERGEPGDRDEVKGQEIVRHVRHAAWPRLCRASNTAWPTLLALEARYNREVLFDPDLIADGLECEPDADAVDEAVGIVQDALPMLEGEGRDSAEQALEALTDVVAGLDEGITDPAEGEQLAFALAHALNCLDEACPHPESVLSEGEFLLALDEMRRSQEDVVDDDLPWANWVEALVAEVAT